jgi:O-antigen/teichoic acid export membrane protein
MGSIKHIAKNSFFLSMLTFSNYFIGLLLFPYISHILSVEMFGLIGFSMAYAVIFQVIVEFGFIISTTATIAKHRSNSEKVSEIVSATMYAKTILAIISVLLFILSAMFVPTVQKHMWIISLFVTSSLLSAMLPDFFFRGIEKMKTITIRTVSIRLLSLLLIVIFVHNESQIILIPTSFIICNSIALIVSIIFMKKEGVKLRRVQAKQAIGSIRESSMFFASRLAASINQSIGAFFIGLGFSPTSVETGMFAGATRISSASEMMLTPVADSLYPHMVCKRDYVLFKKVVLVGGATWFIGCLVAFIFANDICRIILGSKYAAAGELLRILLFGNFMAFFSNMFGYNALVPIGKSNHANIALLASAAITVMICGLLWLTDSINLVSVCSVVALANFIVFGYRGAVFWKNRHLTQQKQG